MSTLCVESGRLHHWWEQNVLLGAEGFHFKPPLSVMPSLVCAAVGTCYADLCTPFFSAVSRVTRGKHTGRVSVEEEKVNVLHSGDHRVTSKWLYILCVHSQELIRNHLQSVLQIF